MRKKQTIAVLLVLSLLLSVFCVSPLSTAYAADTDNDEPALNEKHVELVEKDTFLLKVENVEKDQTLSFKSSDTSVATVSSDGQGAKIKAVGIGMATVTVKIRQKRLFFSKVVDTLECDVLVGPPALSIKCKHTKIQMTVGQTKKMSLVLKPSNTTEIPQYESSFPAVVSVSKNGRLAAKKGGKAVITASIANQNSTSCIVIVSEQTDNDNKEKDKE